MVEDIKYIKVNKTDKNGKIIPLETLAEDGNFSLIHRDGNTSKFNILNINDKGNYFILEVTEQEITLSSLENDNYIKNYPTFSLVNNRISSATTASFFSWKESLQGESSYPNPGFIPLSFTSNNNSPIANGDEFLVYDEIEFISSRAEINLGNEGISTPNPSLQYTTYKFNKNPNISLNWKINGTFQSSGSAGVYYFGVYPIQNIQSGDEGSMNNTNIPLPFPTGSEPENFDSNQYKVFLPDYTLPASPTPPPQIPPFQNISNQYNSGVINPTPPISPTPIIIGTTPTQVEISGSVRADLLPKNTKLVPVVAFSGSTTTTPPPTLI